MTSPFFGLDIATRALHTQQTLVDIANQNVANANTPGYSRQTAAVQATPAYPIPVFNTAGMPGQLGTGVTIASITRARDTFLDGQIRNQLSSQGRWDARQTALSQVEAMVNEPSSTGLSSMLTKYWQGWQQVANSPSDTSVRSSLIQQGQALADAFHNQYQQLSQQQQDLDNQVGLTVTNVNDYAQQIANLNKQICMVEGAGMKANDLRDQRDQLLDQLSGLAKVTYVESSDGSMNIYLGNHQLVNRDATSKLQAVPPQGQLFTQVQWADGTPASITDGKLQGILESRDSLVQRRIDELNQVAQRLITSVNGLHTGGVGLDGKSGVPFFDGTDARTIALNAALTGPNGTDHVAAATSYADPSSPTGFSFAAGDSTNAVAIGDLAHSVAQLSTSAGLQPGTTFAGPPSVTIAGISAHTAAANTTYTLSVAAGTTNVTFSDGSTTQTGTLSVASDSAGNPVVTIDDGSFGLRLTLTAPAGTSVNAMLATLDNQTLTTATAPTTIGDQYAQQIAALGVDSTTAQGESANQQVLLKHLQTQRDAVSGVSLDEETTHLIQYQRAYQAAARVVTVVDDMLETLINGTGRVGR